MIPVPSASNTLKSCLASPSGSASSICVQISIYLWTHFETFLCQYVVYHEWRTKEHYVLLKYSVSLVDCIRWTHNTLCQTNAGCFIAPFCPTLRYMRTQNSSHSTKPLPSTSTWEWRNISWRNRFSCRPTANQYITVVWPLILVITSFIRSISSDSVGFCPRDLITLGYSGLVTMLDICPCP